MCFRRLLVKRSVRSEMLDSKYIRAFSDLMNPSSRKSPELCFNVRSSH